MRIGYIHIKNYRRFIDTRVNLSRVLTVIAGANNSGKTSLVHLLDTVFGGTTVLKPKDISLTRQSIIAKRLLKLFTDYYIETTPSDNKKFQSDIIDLFFDKSSDKLLVIEDHISIRFSVYYDADENNIAFFARYLMDLDDKKRIFNFAIEQQINNKSLKQNLIENSEALKDSMIKYFAANKKMEECLPDSPEFSQEKLNQGKAEQFFLEILFSVYGASLHTKYKYANEDYSITQDMEKKDFTSLFNYKYLSADRRLSENLDGKKRTLTSCVVDLLNIEKRNEGSSSNWKSKINTVLRGMSSALINENIDTFLMDEASNLLDNISSKLSAIGETNIQDITMVLDMGMDYLLQFLENSIRVNYAIPTDPNGENKVFLAEETQGLGISNLIFITLELMRYKFEASNKQVNIFIIEEPESHMHLQMQRTLVNYLNSEYLKDVGVKNIQGVITTHSGEIIRSVDLSDIKVIRPKQPLVNIICDMDQFLQRHEEEKNFYETFFKINFSNMIFADKAIIYEGDTERMYIESLIFGNRTESINSELPFLEQLSHKYITYAQAGGAYAHKYATLLSELEISTLILTDIDYPETCFELSRVLKLESTNAALNTYCRLHKCVGKCTDILIEDLYAWQSSDKHEKKVLVKTQTSKDGYARTLEDALLYQYIKKINNESDIKVVISEDFNVFNMISRSEWKRIRDNSSMVIVLPNRSEDEKKANIKIDSIKRCTRQIAAGLSKHKSSFMYTIIKAGMQFSVIPTYIKEGLNWLAQR